MFFIILLVLTTFGIAASAAFFSVLGLMQTYSAIQIPILIMGSFLEAGKLMTASALYRLWDKLGILKVYLFAALIGLMLMTSLGIFGYLTAGYQKDSIPMEQITQKLEADKQEVDRLIERKKEIDQQIAKLPNNFVNSRQRLMNSFKPELESINPRIESLQKEIAEYQTKKIETEAHIGPVIYVAKLFNRNPDESVFYFTLLIILIFDPLAVALTLVTNMAIKHLKESKEQPVESIPEIEQPNEVEEKLDPEKPIEEVLVAGREDLPPADPNALSREDIVQIVKDSIADEDLLSHKKRKEILSELRK